MNYVLCWQLYCEPEWGGIPRVNPLNSLYSSSLSLSELRRSFPSCSRIVLAWLIPYLDIFSTANWQFNQRKKERGNYRKISFIKRVVSFPCVSWLTTPNICRSVRSVSGYGFYWNSEDTEIVSLIELGLSLLAVTHPGGCIEFLIVCYFQCQVIVKIN